MSVALDSKGASSLISGIVYKDDEESSMTMLH